eukprot:1875778-Rhodomonas_salina.2
MSAALWLASTTSTTSTTSGHEGLTTSGVVPKHRGTVVLAYGYPVWPGMHILHTRDQPTHTRVHLYRVPG